MENYVVSRELAEKLKAAGYPQEPWNFYWLDDMVMTNVHDYKNLSDRVVAAPLSDELLEQLPVSVPDGQADNFLIMRRGRSSIFVGYPNSQGVTSLPKFNPLDHDKPADALAELWLWCKANDYIKTKETN